MSIDFKKQNIAAIILAAGQARRMGQLKQVLPLGERAVIEVVAGVVCSRLDQVLVVVGHRAEEVAGALRGYPLRCVFNPDYAQGMITSVKCGLEAAPQAAGYLVVLGDQPGIDPQSIDAVLQAARDTGRGIAIPTHGGRRGHPIYIGALYRQEILSLPEDRGLNAVTRSHPEDTLEVPVVGGEILEDMDTPEDYRRELARRRKG